MLLTLFDRYSEFLACLIRCLAIIQNFLQQEWRAGTALDRILFEIAHALLWCIENRMHVFQDTCPKFVGSFKISFIFFHSRLDFLLPGEYRVSESTRMSAGRQCNQNTPNVQDQNMRNAQSQAKQTTPIINNTRSEQSTRFDVKPLTYGRTRRSYEYLKVAARC